MLADRRRISGLTRRCSHSPGCSACATYFVYPESGDMVLAGPAGDWFVDTDGRILSNDTHEPVVRLDDLLTYFASRRRGGQMATSAARSIRGK